MLEARTTEVVWLSARDDEDARVDVSTDVLLATALDAETDSD